MYNELEGDIIYDMLHELAMIIIGKEKMMGKMVRIGRILEVHEKDAFHDYEYEGLTCEVRPGGEWEPNDDVGFEDFFLGDVFVRQRSKYSFPYFRAVKIEWIATFPEELLDTYEGGDV